MIIRLGPGNLTSKFSSVKSLTPLWFFVYHTLNFPISNIHLICRSMGHKLHLKTCLKPT